MISFSSLKKDQLIILAKEKNISVSLKMTRAQIITLLENTQIPIPKSGNSKTVKVTKTSTTKHKPSSTKTNMTTPKKTVSIPTKNLSIQFNDTITVLPQADNRVLVIWNADPQDDTHMKAWQITNKLGLDILLPSYARSLFIDISLLSKLDFSLYYIYLNNTKILFKTYREDKPLTYPKLSYADAQKFEDSSISQIKIHPSSSNNFINRLNQNANSSSSHFFRK